MIEETLSPECGQKMLLPDPPPKTKDENIAFRKAWDARVDAGSRSE